MLHKLSGVVAIVAGLLVLFKAIETDTAFGITAIALGLANTFE